MPQNWEVGQLGFESSLVPETRLDQIHEKNQHPLKVERDLFIIFLWIHLRTWRIIPLPLEVLLNGLDAFAGQDGGCDLSGLPVAPTA